MLQSFCTECFYLQFYICLISLHSLFLAINQFLLCVRHEWKECTSHSPPVTIVLLLFLMFEALLFAIFTAVMLGKCCQYVHFDAT